MVKRKKKIETYNGPQHTTQATTDLIKCNLIKTGDGHDG